MNAQLKAIFEECAKLTDWCLEHKGHCFKGWPRETVLFYLAFHAGCGTLFVVRVKDEVKALMIAEVVAMARVNDPFRWLKRTEGDSALVQELIGDRNAMPTLFAMLKAKFPSVKRFFGHRYRGADCQLREFSVPFVERFAHA